MTYDCQHCGACCAPERCHTPGCGCQWPGGFVYLSPDDKRRLPVVYQRHVKGEHLDVKEGRNGLLVCVALRGTIGGEVCCLIYDDRPEVCREFKPGSAECKFAREEQGLGL